MTKPMQSICTSISVFREGDNPIFGESRTEVSLDDEAGGLFFTLKQESGMLRFDFDEFDEVVKAVEVLKQVSKGIDND